MKKNLFAFAAACLIAACGAASANAQELDKNASLEEIAAFEKENFVSFDEINADGAAKAAQNLIAATNEGAEGSDAKCWFWGWRYYSYPSYYYYSWYCPCYYVPFRIVTYTVPTVVTRVSSEVNVVDPAPADNNAEPASNDDSASLEIDPSTVAIAKSSGKTACGAVVDQAVPANSPLAKMGIKRGDVVTHVDGVQVKSIVDLRKVTANSKLKFIPGNQITVSKQQINHVPGASAAKALEAGANGLSDLNIGEKSIKANETVSLYDYYEALENSDK
jgi:hypothetical protein